MLVRFVAGALAIPALAVTFAAVNTAEPVAESSAPVARSAPPSLSALAFMAGCWRGPGSNGATIEEHYTAPSDNLIVGMTRYVRGSRAVDFEFTTIERTDTSLVMVPRPKGVKSVAFAIKELADGRAVFENAAHDFPQRISYRRSDTGSLVARIEGTTPRGERHMEWTMTRCEGAARRDGSLGTRQTPSPSSRMASSTP